MTLAVRETFELVAENLMNKPEPPTFIELAKNMARRFPDQSKTDVASLLHWIYPGMVCALLSVVIVLQLRKTSLDDTVKTGLEILPGVWILF